MSSFPLAGEHSKIYHLTITNADLSHCAALLAFVQVFVLGKMADISEEGYRLRKVQSKLANNCQNDRAWLVQVGQDWRTICARFAVCNKRVKLRPALPRNLLVIVLLTQDLSLKSYKVFIL